MDQKAINNLNLSKKLGVSHPTIGRWIDDATEGKNSLQIVEHNGRYRVAENSHNYAELMRLKEKAIKYRSKSNFQTIYASNEIYDILSHTQLIELICSLEYKYTIPGKFTYFKSDAEFTSSLQKQSLNSSKQTKILLEQSLEYIWNKICQYEGVNIVNIGLIPDVLHSLIIDRCLIHNKKIRYVSLGLNHNSQEVLKNSLERKYPNLEIDIQIGDVEKNGLRDVMFQNRLEYPESCNLITGLDVAANNLLDSEAFQEKLSISLSNQDFLLFNCRLDNPLKRTDFTVINDQPCDFRYLWVADKLGFKKELYITENLYESHSRSQIQILKPTTDLELIFDINNHQKKIRFIEGQDIITMRHKLYSLREIMEAIDRSSLNIQYLATSPEKDQVMVFSER
ncbi:MAG: hypothetical protein AAGF07_03070 [Patescibacteria group bacterium]